MLPKEIKRPAPHLRAGQAVLLACYWWSQGWDTQDIAELLGVSEAAVYNTLAQHREDRRNGKRWPAR